ncbi:restriction endonuclease [Hymenobacter sp. BT491]|uniref:restriction endonuclease n=1 Tax=Hymenobacter sp. BT491 TaxID=2766779 RepID=UPI001653EE0C|nr:restriction endonuclease [Hymenobacter sp. BT491]MBC6988581.1 restriction endonuclease [Hymenobacter sp. BT491]
MSASSDEFEQQISEIHRILADSNSEITWNDRMIDPDNVKQQRQIDISIKNGNYVTHVECRIHKSKQDVKWIEELYGRKMSLGIQNIIGVSSSGFTEGAIKKAKRFGIELRDTLNLEEEDLNSWGKAISLTREYITFKSFNIALFPSEEAAHAVSDEDIQELVRDGTFFTDAVNLLKKSAEEIRQYLQSSGNKSVNHTFYISPKNPVFIKGFELNRVMCQVVQAELVKEEIYLDKPMYFRNSDISSSSTMAYIQKVIKLGGYYVASPDVNRLVVSPHKWQMPQNSVFLDMNFKWFGRSLQLAYDNFTEDGKNGVMINLKAGYLDRP